MRYLHMLDTDEILYLDLVALEEASMAAENEPESQTTESLDNNG